MSWQDTRTSGAAATAVRRAAHSDDAKHRVHDATRLVPRARWVVPAVVAGLLVLLLGGGAVAVLASTSEDSPGSARGTAARPAKDQDSGFDEGTGLPIEPTTETVEYTATSACEKESKLNHCGSFGTTETLACPGGACSFGFWVSPQMSAETLRGAPHPARFTFRAGQPSINLSGAVPVPDIRGCAPEPVTVTGTRGADGGYVLRFVVEYHASNGDGSCAASAGTWSTTLTAPPG